MPPRESEREGEDPQLIPSQTLSHVQALQSISAQLKKKAPHYPPRSSQQASPSLSSTAEGPTPKPMPMWGKAENAEHGSVFTGWSEDAWLVVRVDLGGQSIGNLLCNHSTCVNGLDYAAKGYCSVLADKTFQARFA